MGNLSLTFLPPQNWQDFEKFLKGLVEVIWEQQGWHNYGRQGQNQSGIDLFGYDNKGKFTGIQCKKTKATDSDGVLLTNSSLTQKLLEKEILSAQKIKNPQLQRLIFATTSSRDTKVQDILNSINSQRIQRNEFPVEIWFWEDIQVYIENHTELMYWYYSDVLEKIHQYDKNTHILLMLRQAFTRPAFSRVIRGEESGGDFIQAIKDTQEAITTGKLYNRRGDLLTTSYDYKKIDKTKWQSAIWKIYLDLDEIRKIYQQGVINKTIREHPTCLEVIDNKLADRFNDLRSNCLNTLNEILRESQLELISSELTR